MRKAFNFYRSYYDVIPKIKTDKEKLQYLLALIERQFLGIEPSLEGDADFAYTSQRHSIDKSVEGWENKTKTKLFVPTEGPTQGGYQEPTEGGAKGPTEGGTEGKSEFASGDSSMTTEGPWQGGRQGPWQQEEEEEKEEEEEQGEGQEQEQEQEVQKSFSLPEPHSSQMMYHSLTLDVQKEADRQAEIALEKLFNKN